jgi:hypothetical protein
MSELFAPAPRIGSCIYCYSTTPPLSREHIIPYGLGGTWVLLDASCEKCATITGDFERDVMRRALLTARTVLNLPTRNRKGRPTSLPLCVDQGEGAEDLLVPSQDHPGIAVLPVFPPPARILRNRSYSGGIALIRAEPVPFGRVDLLEMGKSYKKVQIEATYQPTSFARMLAKIAYGYCVGRFGLSAFEKPYVLPAILGQADDVGMWVGCKQGIVNTFDAMHQIRTDVIDGDLLASIRLLPRYWRTEYTVVVGRMVPRAV